MFMGILLKGTVYSKEEYLEAVGITAGVLIFAMSKENFESGSGSNEVLGFMLLCLYVLSDSFTSQWQSRLYRDYGKIDSFQMMFGVNVSAITITAFALVLSGELIPVMELFKYNPSVLYYNIVTSITSTTGQFAIYFTIKRFGPVVFTIIMTTRQMLSIVVSNYYFGHTMSNLSKLGAVIVFSIVMYSIYRQQAKNKAPPAAPPKAASVELAAVHNSSNKV
jgi:solute carrier family 35 (adenosine 3'-phospho 5'-phosphosulfate transporter), member B2